MSRAKHHPDQFGFSFDAPIVASEPAELAGLERQISRAAAEILKGDLRPREILAAEISLLLDEDVSRAMIDAYASPAREGHKVIMSRFLALVAVTKRHDVLDRLMRPIGAAVLVDEEIHTARIGQLELEIAKRAAELKRLKATAPLIRGGNDA